MMKGDGDEDEHDQLVDEALQLHRDELVGEDIIQYGSAEDRRWTNSGGTGLPVVAGTGETIRPSRRGRERNRRRRERNRRRRERSSTENERRNATISVTWNEDQDVDENDRAGDNPTIPPIMLNDDDDDDTEDGDDRVGDNNPIEPSLPVNDEEIAVAVEVNSEDENNANNAAGNGQTIAVSLATQFEMGEDAISRWNEPLCEVLDFITYGRMLVCVSCTFFFAAITLTSFVTAFLLRRNESTVDINKITSTRVPTLRPTSPPSKQNRLQTDVPSTPRPKTTWVQMSTAIYGESNNNLGWPTKFLNNGSTLWVAGNGVLREYEWKGYWSKEDDLSYFYNDLITSLSVSSNELFMVVGTPYFQESSGAVFIYNQTSESNWALIGQVFHNTIGSCFGYSSTISDDGKLVVAGTYSFGFIKMICLKDEEYVVLKEMSQETLAFGHAVKLNSDGSKLIISAPVVDKSNGDVYGAVRIINTSDESVLQTISTDTVGDGCFGCHLATSAGETYLAIGSTGSYVKVYKFDPNEKRYVQYGDTLQDTPDSRFGYSISLSSDGSRLAVGAPEAFGVEKSSGNFVNSGKAYVYDNIGDNWSLSVEFLGEANYSWSGCSVVLSADGEKLAITACSNSGIVTMYEVVS